MKATAETSYIASLVNTFTKEEVWEDFHKKFPACSRARFTNTWWYYTVGKKQAKTKHLMKTETKTLSKEDAWNAVVAIVNENAKLRAEIVAVTAKINAKDRKICELMNIINTEKIQRHEKLEYEIGIQNGDIHTPLINEGK